MYLAGGLVMAYNVYMTIKGKTRNEKPIVVAHTATAQPAE